MEELRGKLAEKDKELKSYNKELKNKTRQLQEKIAEKRKSLTAEEAKELILDKFYELINEKLKKYLKAEKRELIKVFEKLWDNYRVPLFTLKEERDTEINKLNQFLEKLGYYERV